MKRKATTTHAAPAAEPAVDPPVDADDRPPRGAPPSTLALYPYRRAEPIVRST